MTVSIMAPGVGVGIQPAVEGWAGADAPRLIDSKFAHTIAHDLRSPLTAIQMCADALSASEDSLLRQKYATVIAEQAKSIAWSLENLVTIADDDLWQENEKGTVNIAELVRESLDELRVVAESRQIDVRWESLPRELWAQGVEMALYQALRGCVHVMLTAGAPGTELLVTGDVGDTDGPGEGMASLSLIVRMPSAPSSQPLEGIELPWRRVTLPAAVRIIREHGGTVHEVRGADALGLKILLPAAPGEE